MKILKIQPNLDPRSYKLVRTLRSIGGLDIVQKVYGPCRADSFYAKYRGESTQIVPELFRQRNWGYQLNWAVLQLAIAWHPMQSMVRGRLRELELRENPDIIHTNGAPDVFGVLCARECNAPVVHEIYDTYSLYDVPLEKNPGATDPRAFISIPYERRLRRLNLAWEEYVHRECDAMVFTSDEMMRYSNERYGRIRSIVVPNGVLREHLPKMKSPKLSASDGCIHCVYVGAVEGGLPHRMIVHLMQEATSSRKVVLHIYPTTKTIFGGGLTDNNLERFPNIRIHEPLHYRQLYSELPQYDLGLVLLNPKDCRLLDVALPNKVFEYVGAGLPIAIPPYHSLINFVRRFNCGFVVTDWSTGIVDNTSLIRAVPFREEFTIDYYAPLLAELYRQLAG